MYASTRSTYTPIFLRKLSEFIDKLEDRFPTESDIGYLNTAINMVKKTNPEIVIKGYYNYVYKYKKQINEKDEQFLLSEKYSDVAETSEDQNDAYIKIDHFKKLFQSNSMDDTTKKSIWAYLQLLNTVMEKIMDSNEVELT